MSSGLREFLLLAQIFSGALYLSVGVVLLVFGLSTGGGIESWFLAVMSLYGACLLGAMAFWFSCVKSNFVADRRNIIGICIFMFPVVLMFCDIRMEGPLGENGNRAFSASGMGFASIEVIAERSELIIWLGTFLLCPLWLTMKGKRVKLDREKPMGSGP
jgi:hypothetical protein